MLYVKIAGVQLEQQMELFRILSAVLHLGNVNIRASGRSCDRSYIDVMIWVKAFASTHLSFRFLHNTFVSQAEDCSLAVFSKLLGVEGSQVAHWLCHRRLAVGGEMLVKPMTGQQALEARDALAKHIYGQLFTWTGQRLNSALRAQQGRTKSFVGVLDIYGWVSDAYDCLQCAIKNLWHALTGVSFWAGLRPLRGTVLSSSA